jgi:hypothetical protein
MRADPLGAHLREELSLSEQTRARPVQAALVSAASFAVGAALPLLALLLASPTDRVAVIAASALGLLALLVRSVAGWAAPRRARRPCGWPSVAAWRWSPPPSSGGWSAPSACKALSRENEVSAMV